MSPDVSPVKVNPHQNLSPTKENLWKTSAAAKIGGGYFSTVFALEPDPDLPIPMAKKEFRKEISKNSILNEINIASFLKEHNCQEIPEFYGYAKLNNRHCLISQHISHGNLENFWSHRDGRERFHLATLACRALLGLEQLGIEHRDVKADNFLVQVENSSLTVLITDFGLAVNRKNPPPARIGGNQNVTPPEELFGLYNPHNEKFDSWSFGLMLLNGLTDYNETPFRNIPQDQERQELLHSSLWVTQLKPMQFSNLLRGLLEPDPINRSTRKKAFRILNRLNMQSVVITRKTLGNAMLIADGYNYVT